MIPWEVTKAKALSGYRLEVTFADGLQGTVDLSDIPHVGVFKAWSEPGFFELARVDAQSGTVCWPNGADVAPDVLYKEVKGRQSSAA